MTKLSIAHLSDPHFGRLNRGVDEAILHFFDRKRPDLVLLSGDITQRAKRSQFLAAREFVKRLAPTTTFAVPGNHDIPLLNLPKRLMSPYANFHTYFQTKRETQIKIGDVCVTGLNSTSRWRHVQGALSLSRARPLLENQRDCEVKVVAIHHPLDCAKHVDEKNLIKNGVDVASLFAETRSDLILSGHIHDPFIDLSHSRYPSIQRSMILSVAGTCISRRTRAGAPNSFTWIDILTGADATISLTRIDLAPCGEFQATGPAESFHRRDSAGWTRE